MRDHTIARKSLRLLGALLWWAVSVAATAADGPRNDVLNASLLSDIRSTQPGMTPDDSTAIVLLEVVEGLVASTANGIPQPMLASHIDVSPDGRTYTFALRHVLFHNGQPLTAADVVWTWRRYLDPDTHWSCRAYFDGSGRVKIDSVTALDSDHVRFELERPAAEFLSMMARPDCNETAILSPASVGPDGKWIAPIGTGPYRFVKWKKGEYIDLARFRRYRPAPGKPDGYAGNKTAYIDRLHFVVIPDSASTKAALENGDIDVWYSTNPEYLDEMRANTDVKVTFAPGLGPDSILFQTNDRILRDPRIRRAIAMAIDAKSLIKVEEGGLVPVNNSLIPVTNAWYGKVEANEGIPYNLAEAKRLLKEAGYRGEPITLITNTQYKLMYDTALIVQAMAQLAGINVQVEALEFGSMLQHFFSGKYQMMVFNTAANLDPVFTFDRFIGDKTENRTKVWDDPKARDLLAQLMTVSDPQEKQRLFDELHRLFIGDVPLFAMHTGVVFSAANRHVAGFAAWPGRRPRFWGVKFVQ